MATTIINPGQNTNTANNSLMSFLLGIVVLVVLVALFIIYAVPFIRGLSGSGGGIQINLPKSVNVNVQQAK